MAQVVFAPEAVSNRLKIVAGEAALDGSNPTPVDFSAFFSTAVVAVVVNLAGATTPGDGTRLVTYSVSGKTVNFYAWKAAAADPTLEASTGTDTFSYVVVGY